MNAPFLSVHPQVQEALNAGQPVVALESTLIAHGLPSPHNLHVARRMEHTVREAGATPATIALVDGTVRVGLTDDELTRLAHEPAVKVSLHTLAITLAQGHLGATTVAATAWAAAQAGIHVFATGGIGGVHPGEAWDISADLPALATFPVAVVCSGPKAILHLERTRQWLETWGVPVLGYRTDTLPAFFSRTSGLPVDARVDSPEEAAAVVRTHLALGRGGVLVAVPVPADDEVPADQVNDWLVEAERRAAVQGVTGPALTPFLLETLTRLSGGAPLRANVALLINNAFVAAQLAGALRHA
ncbi:MAG: pseudouridine-5'-phosphate glycosidase [Ardenticatenia bacterium]|nr:pseudouridine-5'-phosphate glycosidase [Ardenticatenia bacterium]